MSISYRRLLKPNKCHKTIEFRFEIVLLSLSFIFTVVFVLVNWLIENKNCPSGVWSRAPTAQSFSTIFSTQDGLSWHYNIVDYHAAIGEIPRDLPCSLEKMLRCNCLDAVDLSKTSCSQTALNGFVLDMSGGGQAKRICLQHLDMSRCCRQIRIWSLRADLS